MEEFLLKRMVRIRGDDAVFAQEADRHAAIGEPPDVQAVVRQDGAAQAAAGLQIVDRHAAPTAFLQSHPGDAVQLLRAAGQPAERFFGFRDTTHLCITSLLRIIRIQPFGMRQIPLHRLPESCSKRNLRLPVEGITDF